MILVVLSVFGFIGVFVILAAKAVQAERRRYRQMAWIPDV